MSTAAAGPATRESAAVRPFEVEIAEAELTDLRRRIDATRWPERETVSDDSQGVTLAISQGLARHWAGVYDWRLCEARLNALPQFTTEVDGLEIHFIHVRSQHDDALPLIVTHGWPGSIIEQLKIIDPLTNPTAHGGSAADAFDVVIPSIPGYGFSAKPTSTGWDPAQIARTWVTLMKRLGYAGFVAQGGDVGAFVCDRMGEQAPPELLGIHTNFPAAVPPEIFKALQAGEPAPAGLSAPETRAYEELRAGTTHRAYALMMGTRPQTLYALADSPVGLAAWIVDHGDGTGQPGLLGGVAQGNHAGELTRDDLLDNITLYWLTNTAVSAARLYWDNKLPAFLAADVTVPAAVSVFPHERYQPPRSWVQRAYRNLIHYNELDRGGHFAAWEEPQLFAKELRAAFKPLR